MSSPPDDSATLIDVFRAAELVMAFVRGVTQVEFLRNEMMQSAIEMQLAVMGEAVKRLSPELRDRDAGLTGGPSPACGM